MWAAAWYFHARDDPAAEDWAAVQALAVLASGARHAAESIAVKAGACGLADDRRTGVQACAT
ncbi:MAG TPA: hypothetical protein VGS06_05870 [Streptosporangiaceae bacterium]|nr:hypothetical protein [Streptosporangiaceae bacterium]